MSKKVGMIIGVIIVIALIVFFATKSKKGSEESMVNSGTPPVAENVKSSMEQKSMNALLSSGTSKKCTFTDTQVNSSSQGTVYISGGKMRGDFTATSQGQTSMSHMITEGTTSYVWVDGQTTGFKMTATGESSSAGKQSQTGVDPNQNYDFSCENWSTDSGKFSLPSNVKFEDFSSLLQQAPPPSGGAQPSPSSDSEMMKAACAGLEEPAKTQCLNAVK